MSFETVKNVTGSEKLYEQCSWGEAWEWSVCKHYTWQSNDLCETEKKPKSALSKSVVVGSVFNYSTICK